MTAALTVQENGHGADLITFDDSKVGLIKRTIAQDATDDELALFLHQAQRTGLDPLARQIYFQKYKTKNGPQIAIITGIDGYRLVAVRTGLDAGNDAPEFEGRINYQGNDVPAKASVTVYRIVGNRRCAFTSSVYWNEYCPNPPKDYQWKKMPHVMLAKCAEAAALRKAFPADLSGVYTREEMGQADWFDDSRDNVTIDTDSGEIIEMADENLPVVNQAIYDFSPDDEVVVIGKKDEKLGTVVGLDETGTLVVVKVGGKQLKLSPDKLRIIEPAVEQEPLFADGQPGNNYQE